MTARKCSNDFERQMKGWSLTTAEILYRMPDHRSILQTFLWQDYDLAPRFPELEKFLDFWNRELAGPIFKVEVSHRRLIGPNEWRRVDALYGPH